MNGRFCAGVWLVAWVVLTAAGLADQPAGPAGPAGKDAVIVTVTGQSAHSFEEAKEDALRNAVEMGAGKEVFSDTRVADFTLRHDTIVSRAAGYVKSYDILEKKEQAGVYLVKVQAVVAVGQIKDDWGALQILIQRKGRPNLLILCQEEAHNMFPTANAAEYKLRELLGERGFDLVDDETLAKVVDREVTRAILARDEAKAVAAAKQLRAGYVVLARSVVRAGKPSEPAPGVRLSTANAEVYVKVVATDNAQQIASKSASSRGGAREDTAAAGKKALDAAVAQVEPEVFQRIVAAWSRDLDAGSKFEVVGTRIPTKVLDAIVDGLRKTDGVKTVQIVDHNEELSTLAVVTRLESKELGKAIEKASANKVEVTGLSAGRVTFRVSVGGN